MARAVRWAVLATGAGVLIATSYSGDLVRDVETATVGEDGRLLLTIQIDALTLKDADWGSLSLLGPLVAGDADAGPTLRALPGGETVAPTSGGSFSVHGLVDRCEGDGDCVIAFELVGAEPGVEVEVWAELTARHSGGFLCGSPGEFDDDASVTLVVE